MGNSSKTTSSSRKTKTKWTSTPRLKSFTNVATTWPVIANWWSTMFCPSKWLLTSSVITSNTTTTTAISSKPPWVKLERSTKSIAPEPWTSLSLLFRDLHRDTGSRIDRQSEEFMCVKELAKRFALSFGLDALKNREAITALHRDAILFATNPLENPNDPTGPPPNLTFLEIAAEFTNKLLKQDKKMVLQFLDRILTMGM